MRVGPHFVMPSTLLNHWRGCGIRSRRQGIQLVCCHSTENTENALSDNLTNTESDGVEECTLQNGHHILRTEL